MCMCRYAWEIVRLYKYTYICLHGFVCMHIYRIYNNLCQAMPQSHMYDATFLANTQIGTEQNSWNGGHGFRGKPESYIPIWTLSNKLQFSSPMLLEIYSNHFLTFWFWNDLWTRKFQAIGRINAQNSSNDYSIM